MWWGLISGEEGEQSLSVLIWRPWAYEGGLGSHGIRLPEQPETEVSRKVGQACLRDAQ